MIRVAVPSLDEEEIFAVREVLLSGKYVSGEKVKAFEEKFADYIGTRHAVALNSGTAALHTVLAALRLQSGDEVIVPPLTFFASISSVLQQSATPVFADIDPNSYCLDAREARKKITPKTKAILVVHLFGQAAPMHEFEALSQETGIPIIEDAAQAHGTTYFGNKVGALSKAGAFSFFATKAMTTGEGGMITTQDAEIAEFAKKFRNHGMSDRNTHPMLGYNYRMTEMAAAIGLVQLRKLEAQSAKRIENSLYLIDRLRHLNWLKGPALYEGIKHTFFWVPFWVREEVLGLSTRELIERLAQKGVEVRHRYDGPLYRQPLFKDKYQDLYLANAEKVAGKLIGLPNHAGLTRSELDRVVEIVSGIAGDLHG